MAPRALCDDASPRSRRMRFVQKKHKENPSYKQYYKAETSVTRVVFSKNTFFGTGAALARDERIAGIQVSVRDNVVVGAGGFRSQE